MTKSELAIVIILRVVGIAGLFAIPAIFLPYAWMNAIHGYLARSLSAFYAVVSATTLLISTDIRRYRSFVALWAILVILTGFVLLGVDIGAGMPIWWTVGEGPPTVVVGVVVLYLQRTIPQPDPAD